MTQFTLHSPSLSLLSFVSIDGIAATAAYLFLSNTFVYICIVES